MLGLPGMDGNHPEATVARFPADHRAVTIAVETARRFADAAALMPTDRVKLAIVVEELVANLVEHGGGGDQPIELALRRHPTHVALTLSDGGIPFDPRRADRPAIPPARGGGAGIGLILAWTRIVAYERAGTRNRLSLVMPRVG